MLPLPGRRKGERTWAWKIHKEHPMKTCKGCLFRTCYSKGVGHHRMRLADTQRQAEEWESFMVGKREGFRCALIQAVGR